MIIEELLVKLGFFSDLKGLESFKASVVGTKKQITSFIAGVEAAGLAVSAFFAHSLEGIDQQARFAQQVGVSIQQLQQLQYAANISGGTTDDLNASMKGLSKSIFEASEGAGGAVEVFGRLGVATMANGHLRDTVAVFKDLADKIKTLPSAEQQDFAQKVGISNTTLLLLQQGSAGIAKLSSEANKLGLYSDQDAKKAEVYAESWRSLVQVFTVLKNQLALGLAPVFTDIIKSLTEWLTVNKEFIIQDISIFLKVVIEVMKIFFTVLGDIIHVTDSTVEALGGFKNILELIASSAGIYALINLPKILVAISNGYRAAAAWAAAFDFAAFGAVILLTVGIIALGVLVQDLWVWFEGGNSVLGRIIGNFSKFKSGLKDIYHALVDTFVEAITFIWNFAKAFNQDFVDGFYFAIDEIVKYFTDIIDVIENKIQAVSDFFGKIKDKTKSFFEKDNNNILVSGQGGVVSPSIPLTNGAQISNIVNNSNSSGDTSANSSHSNTFHITVNGASGNKDVANAVKQGIYDASRQAYRNNASPVRI